MKSRSFPFSGRHTVVLGGVVLAGLLSLGVLPGRAEDAAAGTNNVAPADDEADKAWREVRKSQQAPMPPQEWQEKSPSREEVAKFYLEALHKSADKAKDFYTHYPKSSHVKYAQKMEYQLLTIAATQFGDATQTARLDELDQKRMADPSLSEDDKFKLRMTAVQRLMARLPETSANVDKGIAALQKDFPNREEVFQLLMMQLMRSEGDKATALAKQIVDNPAAPDQIKEQAKGILKRQEAVGKPLDIQFTAFDGRQVDLSKMKGKVVLVDFWATWCGPCMGEVPHVKETYQKLHDKGFEIVGISFDQDKDALDKTLKEKEMTWPQFFDGEGWKNKFGQEFGINSIPAMWLVDKKGNLRDVDARGALDEKVSKLLAE